MKFFIAIIVLLAYASPAGASDETDILSTMKKYWAAYSNMNFKAAADFICPADLDLAKSELLPIFLAAGNSSDPELHLISNTFFSKIPQKSRSEATGQQVFVGLNNFIVAANPKFFEFIQGSSIEPIEIELSSKNKATLTYRIEIQDLPVTDIERFSKPYDEWCLRVKEHPRDTAAKFRLVLGL